MSSGAEVADRRTDESRLFPKFRADTPTGERIFPFPTETPFRVNPLHFVCNQCRWRAFS